MDITELILRDHHRIRTTFAELDDIDRDDTEALGALWDRLAALLEAHAAAEEKHFYPRLLEIGEGATDADDAEEEAEDAITDHNDITEAVAEAGEHEVGSDAWWDAVKTAREENSSHLGEEERQALADFRLHATLEERHELGVAYARFLAEHVDGYDRPTKDADEYIEEHAS